MSLLALRNVSKNFGDLNALQNVSFSLEAGSCLAVLGENGAGKSTLLNCIAGILRPDSGRIELPEDSRPGYLSHKSFLYDELTVEENLKFWARLGGAKDLGRVGKLMQAWGLAGRAFDKVSTLSAGWVKRVSLCRAIINDPQVLLLDEPYSAFDAGGTALLVSAVNEFKAAGKIVIMATHFGEQARLVCTHMARLESGKLIEIGLCRKEVSA